MSKTNTTKTRGGTLEERFWRHVIKTRGCWKWSGTKDKDGYGILSFNRGFKKAHRVSFEIHKGKIGPKLCVCHSCDNRECVNPKHLWVGSQKDNVSDMLKKGRMSNRRGENNGRAKISKASAQQIRDLYKTQLYWQKDLANMFGVSQGNISAVLLNKIW